MANVDYEWLDVLQGPEHRAARKGIVSRIARKPSKGLRGQDRLDYWFDAAQLTTVQWRSTVAMLRDTGYCRLNTGNRFTVYGAMNCQPEGFRIAEGVSQGLRCTLQVCPWDCYRDLLHDYRLIRAALATNSIDLVYIRHQYFLPAVDELGDLLDLKAIYQAESLRARRTCYAYAMKPERHLWGGIWRVVVEPYDKGVARDSWLVSMKIIAAVPAGVQFDSLPRGWKVTNWKHPGENQLTQLMARFHTYPTGLMFGEPKLIVHALNQREGMRLSATTGGFRNLEPMMRAQPKEEGHECSDRSDDQA